MGNHGSIYPRFVHRKWREAAHSRSRAPFVPSSPSGVILAHGGNHAGYSIYLDEGHLCFATCANKKRTVVRSSAAITGSTHFEANWNPNGEMFLKVNNKLVGKVRSRNHPTRTWRLHSDRCGPDPTRRELQHAEPLLRHIENLTFKYPNGT